MENVFYRHFFVVKYKKITQKKEISQKSRILDIEGDFNGNIKS